MDKLELKNKIRRNLNTTGVVSFRNVSLIVDEVFKVIMDALEEGDEVKIYGFGKFTTSTVREFESVNPLTNDKMFFPERTRVNFTSGKHLKDKLRK